MSNTGRLRDQSLGCGARWERFQARVDIVMRGIERRDRAAVAVAVCVVWSQRCGARRAAWGSGRPPSAGFLLAGLAGDMGGTAGPVALPRTGRIASKMTVERFRRYLKPLEIISPDHL